jgi:hypothetical protein
MPTGAPAYGVKPRTSVATFELNCDLQHRHHYVADAQRSRDKPLHRLALGGTTRP